MCSVVPSYPILDISVDVTEIMFIGFAFPFFNSEQRLQGDFTTEICVCQHKKHNIWRFYNILINILRLSKDLFMKSKLFGGGCRVSEEQEIKQYLEENGISQAHLSRKTGISPYALSCSLSGKRKMTLREYSVICWALGVNTDKFLSPREPSKIPV